MKIRTKDVRNVTAVLDEIIEEYKIETPKKKRDWRTYEQRVAERSRKMFTELKPLVSEASRLITIIKKDTRGTKQKLSLEQKVLILLLKHYLRKSNRIMSALLGIFLCLMNIFVSYKTVERLYSDREVILCLHNLHILILKKKGIKYADVTGDGTGYALIISKHYATEAQKLKDKIKEYSGKKDPDKKRKKGSNKKHKKRQFVYSLAIMDIKTRMYLGYGTGFRSENEAFLKALSMTKWTIEEANININSCRLDKYFSAPAYVKLIQKNLGMEKVYLIPKTNATVKGPWGWKKTLYNFVHNTKNHLKEYYQRNQSESGISEDKRRTGWQLGQKRPDRIETANMLTHLWHNLSWRF